ncbi:DUF2142 domain-containing protein [Blautia sp. An46]|uniref:DUF2142 domain-containing protein n=1 Tax=Blautia sp. An46 TaxID=1965636 RepID=UPI000B3A13FD|nr:DUF2142 domain-containing protein [Blautia sp. An46]OUN90342.1 hypothetical protein B5G00_16575 [Blautia sp. An46]
MKLKKKEQKRFNGLILLVVLLLIGFLAGIVGEGLYELNICRRALKGGNEIGTEEIDSTHMQITQTVEGEKVDDAEAEKNVNSASEDLTVLKQIHITIDERFINKLCYAYSTDEDFTAYITIHTKDVYNAPITAEIQDFSRKNLNETVINLKDYVTEIFIEVPENVEISNIVVDNSWDWNWYRVAYIGVFIFIVLSIFCFRKIIAAHIEKGFLLLSLCCGMLFIAIQPPECTTWDEHIHFAKAFDWFENGTADRTESEAYLYYYPEQENRAPFLSKEEKAMQIQYLNSHHNGAVETYERDAYTLNAVGELHMALAIKVVKYLGLPFYAQFIAGKIANLLLYTLLIYWAIKIIPVGKKFLTSVSLMPTLMIQSTSYTYDIVVIGFLVLGMAMVIAEYFQEERIFSWKKTVFIAILFIIGSCPKPVYIPLLASLIALPEKKFKTKRHMILCKTFLIVVCMIMIMTLLIPAASGGVEADSRGGATDVAQQMGLVLSQPFSYIQIFITDVISSLNGYIFNASALSTIPYAGTHPFEGAVSLLCLGIALTEKKPVFPASKKNIVRFKVIMTLIVVGTLGLVWSALYIVFTPVGNMHILGVQARYYIPLIIPAYMIFYTKKIETNYRETTYNTIMLLIILWLAHGTMYDQFFLTYCQ